eukprot:758405-Hanusia_phi.AAC.4
MWSIEQILTPHKGWGCSRKIASPTGGYVEHVVGYGGTTKGWSGRVVDKDITLQTPSVDCRDGG